MVCRYIRGKKNPEVSSGLWCSPDPLQVYFPDRIDKQGHLFYLHRAGVEAKPFILRGGEILDVKISLHDDLLGKGQVIFIRQIFFQYYKAEITRYVGFIQGIVAASDIYLPVLDQVLHHLPEKQVDALFHPEA